MTCKCTGSTGSHEFDLHLRWEGQCFYSLLLADQNLRAVWCVVIRKNRDKIFKYLTLLLDFPFLIEVPVESFLVLFGIHTQIQFKLGLGFPRCSSLRVSKAVLTFYAALFEHRFWFNIKHFVLLQDQGCCWDGWLQWWRIRCLFQ